MMLLLLAARCYADADPITDKSAMGSVRGVFFVIPPGTRGRLWSPCSLLSRVLHEQGECGVMLDACLLERLSYVIEGEAGQTFIRNEAQGCVGSCQAGLERLGQTAKGGGFLVECDE
ncbi:hypothetical protein C1886_24450 [Pseudomonas sp. FW300-N1A1]|nr:hypothetical protein C1886_24450 [Pseudomonas sp. FW300-N1A1]